MNLFLLNILLACVWMLLNGDYASEDFLIGFLVGFLALSLTQSFDNKPSYGKKFWAAVKLLTTFIVQLLIGSLEVVWDVLTPTHLSEPKIIRIPLDAQSDFEITLLANLISLTPGSLTLDVSEDKSHLIIHAMFAKDEEQIINDIKNSFERLVLEVTRD